MVLAMISLGLLVVGPAMYRLGQSMERKSERAKGKHIFYHHIREK
jgi:hypothetical protein